MPNRSLSLVVTIGEDDLKAWARRYVSDATFKDVESWWRGAGEIQLKEKCRASIKSVMRGSDRAVSQLRAITDARRRQERTLSRTGDAMTRLAAEGG